MEEIFKDVKGYEGLYKVSNLGRVKSLKYGKQRILKPQHDSYRYHQVRLFKNSKGILYKVHRLVAIAFVPNQNNKPSINHKDGNKLNNFTTNIEWCTDSENIKHSIQNGWHKVPKKKVDQLSLTNELIATFNSQSEAFRKTGISNRRISDVCNGVKILAGGYKWRFAIK